MRLHQRMTRTADDADVTLRDFHVARVLHLLGDDYLGAAAANAPDAPRRVTIECSFITDVWDDRQVASRIAALEAEGIKVTRHRHETTVADQTFSRWQLIVAF